MPQISDPRELFAYKVGAALTMEDTVLQLLQESAQQATDDQIKQKFQHHAEETQGQIQNLEQVFQALGQEPQRQPCPAIEGIQREAQEMKQTVSPELLDSVIVGGAAEVEHHEISVYEGLLTKANAMGEEDITGLLQENLDQETHTLQEVQTESERLAQQIAQQVA